ncbi:MAG: tetratricopeptide repeat protein [Planctomycetota bacterium]|jgi:tetratricopeptide (TPR) repeat protein
MQGRDHRPWLSWGPARLRLAAASLLVIMTLAAYLPALSAGFVFDDRLYVTENPRLGSLEGLGKIWTAVEQKEAQHQYYPLTSSGFWLQHQLWGLRPVGYHLVNVLLHAANAVLLWRLLRRLGVPGAWLAGAVFALHPVHVQSVAWVSELKNVLSTLFFLSSALAFVRFFELGASSAVGGPPDRGKRDWTAYGVGLVLFCCALLSKTVTCSLPIVLLLILWWKRDRLSRLDLMPLLPMVVIGAGFVAMTLYLESTYIGARGERFDQSWLERSLIAGRAVWFYAAKLAWPQSLMFIYPRWEVDPGAGWQYLPVLCAVGVLALLWVGRRRLGKGPLVAIICFLVTVAPVSFVDVAYMRLSFVADHWQYWGSMALIALGVAGLIRLRRWEAGRWVGTVGAPAALTILWGMTWQRAHVFESPETLWTDTLARNPGAWVAHNNLGIALSARGAYDEAIHHHRLALALKPDYAAAHYNLGIAYRAQGRFEAAIDHYRASLRRAPDSGRAYTNLGEVYQANGQPDAAVWAYREAIRVSPDSVLGHYNLGVALKAQGRLDEAVGHYREALRLQPDSARVHNNLGEALRAQDRLEEAMEHYGEAIRLQPNAPEPHYNMGLALEAAGRRDLAIAYFHEAVRLKPESATGHYTLALAYEAQGRMQEAIRHFRQALPQGPDPADVHNHLGAALAQQGRLAEAVDHFQAALRLKPDHSGAQLNLTSALDAQEHHR